MDQTIYDNIVPDEGFSSKNQNGMFQDSCDHSFEHHGIM